MIRTKSPLALLAYEAVDANMRGGPLWGRACRVERRTMRLLFLSVGSLRYKERQPL